MAVMFFPPMLRNALVQSDAYRAAWYSDGTPASKAGTSRNLRSRTS